MSLRERFRLEDIESEKLKQNVSFPKKEKTEVEDLKSIEVPQGEALKSLNQESLKDLDL